MSHEPADRTGPGRLLAAWTRLCALLEDDPELVPAVRLAIEDPQAYLELQLAGPGLPGAGSSPGAGTPAETEVWRESGPWQEVDVWQALLDGLDDAGALAYLEADDAGMELAEALAPLPRVLGSGIDLDEVTDLEGDLGDIIAVADLLLSARGLRIVQLEEDAESCPLVVVPAEHVAEILALVASLGQSARTFT